MNKSGVSQLAELLSAVQSKKEMEALLRAIFTPQELEDLPKRLQIFEQLKKGTPQHEIAKKVGVGVATVTRGSLEMQRGHIQKTSWWQNLSHMRG